MVWGNSRYIPAVEYIYVQIYEDDENCIGLSEPKTEAELVEVVDVAIDFLSRIDRLAPVTLEEEAAVTA